LYTGGDPHRLTWVRSTAKPAQALAVLEASDGDDFGFDTSELALLCASHSAEPMHLERAAAMLARVGLHETDLCCGGHPSLNDAVTRAWIRRDYEPGPLCSNCSGKHIGMAVAARALTGTAANYDALSHPVQQRVCTTLAALVGLAPSEIGWAIDGCNLPTPSLPLERLARLYAVVTDAADSVARWQAAAVSPRTQRLARLYGAMTRYPELVAGTGRFCTALMQSFDGGLIGKVGAEGCYAVGLRAELTAHLPTPVGALGIAIKVEDGNGAVVAPIVCEVLRQLNVPVPEALQPFYAPVLRNTVGVPVGHIALSLRLIPTV
jgi:L-asparaginase II